MGATNPVGTWTDSDFQTQTGTAYKTNLDNDLIVGKRITDAFAPHEVATPSMNVLIDAGHVFIDQTLTEKAQQTIGPFTAPSVDPRIDRIVKDRVTGNAEIVAGTESATPSPPAIPGEKDPICQVKLIVGQTSITNQDITDERLSVGAGGVQVKDRVTADTIVSNTAAETTIYTKSIDGGGLGTKNRFRLQLQCSLSLADSGTDNVIIRLKYGATTVATMKVQNNSAVSTLVDAGLLVTGLLSAKGSATSQRGLICANSIDQFGSSILLSGAGEIQVTGGRGTAAENSANALNLVVTVQFSVAAAGNSITMEHATLEKLAD